MAAEFKNLALTINGDVEMIEAFDQKTDEHLFTIQVIRCGGKQVRMLLQAPESFQFRRVVKATGEMKQRRKKV